MPKRQRILVEANSIMSRLSAFRAEHIELLLEGSTRVLRRPPTLASTHTPSELLYRAAVLLRLVRTFEPLSPGRMTSFRQQQETFFEGLVESTGWASTEFVGAATRCCFELAGAAHPRLIDRLFILDAMLPKTRGCDIDRDVLDSLEDYLARNRQGMEPVVLACELDMRLTRMARAGYLNQFTPPFFVALVLMGSGYPWVCLPPRVLTDDAVDNADRYADLLFAYARHAVHTLSVSLAALLLQTDEWPSNAAFYSDPELELSLETLLKTLRDPGPNVLLA